MSLPNEGARNRDFLVDESFHDTADDLVLRTRHLTGQLVCILALQIFTAIIIIIITYIIHKVHNEHEHERNKKKN